MPKLAGLFGGQGSQYAKMGEGLLADFECARRVYSCGGDILGYDLKKVSGDEAMLSSTLYAQPAIFALSVAAYTAATREIEALTLSCVAGHSLGEYAALCCAKAFSLEDGFRIIKERAKAMDEAKRGGAMYAIMGKDAKFITEECEKSGGYVLPVNYNQPNQTVISGEEKAAQKAAEALSAAGATVVKLNVSGAFHTALMSEAAASFKSQIADVKFSPPSIPFYSNLAGGLLDIDDYPAYFEKHMISPVLFSKQIKAMTLSGVDTCVEFGAKKTASTLAKKNAKGLSVYSVEDMSGIVKLKEALRS